MENQPIQCCSTLAKNKLKDGCRVGIAILANVLRRSGSGPARKSPKLRTLTLAVPEIGGICSVAAGRWFVWWTDSDDRTGATRRNKIPFYRKPAQPEIDEVTPYMLALIRRAPVDRQHDASSNGSTSSVFSGWYRRRSTSRGWGALLV